MGLKTVVNNAIITGFKALGESTSDGLQVLVDYYRVDSLSNYDATTGTRSDVETLYQIEAIFYSARSREIDGIKILVDDKRLIFPTSRLTFSPNHDDRIEIGSDKYNIVNLFQDPSESVWTLFIRGT